MPRRGAEANIGVFPTSESSRSRSKIFQKKTWRGFPCFHADLPGMGFDFFVRRRVVRRPPTGTEPGFG